MKYRTNRKEKMAKLYNITKKNVEWLESLGSINKSAFIDKLLTEQRKKAEEEELVFDF